MELPQATAADPGRPGVCGQRSSQRRPPLADLGRARRGHLFRGLPPHPAAPRSDPGRRADRAARRRGRPGRARDRGPLARGALRVPGIHSRARHGEGDPAADGLPHLQQHPGALRGAQAALPLPAHRLPRHRPRARHHPPPGARHHRRAGRPGRTDRAVAADDRVAQAPLGVRDPRLGPDPRRAGHHVDRRHCGQGQPAHLAQVPERHRTCGQRAAPATTEGSVAC